MILIIFGLMLILIAFAILSGIDTMKEKKARKLLEQTQIGDSFDTVRDILGRKYKLVTETADTKEYRVDFKNNSVIFTFVNDRLTEKRVINGKIIKDK